MMSLPLDSRLDRWRTCGADMPSAIAQALETVARPPGETPLLARWWLNGDILRGTLGPNGERLTAFTIPKPLLEIYGTGNHGNPGTPGYAWGDGFLRCQPGTVSILMDLDFICADVAPAAHNQERGYNLVFVDDPSAQLLLINCGFYNADSALVLGGNHSHAVNCEIGVKGTQRVGKTGHYGARCRGTTNVIEGLRIRPRFYHAISTQNTRGCVYKDITCDDGQLDFHPWALDETDDDNLYINIDLGKKTESAFDASGASQHLPWSGDGNTFVNIRAQGQELPASAYPSWLNAVRISLADVPLLPPEVPMWNLGDRVEVVLKRNIRAGAGTGQTKLGEQPVGAKGTLATGPVSADGFTWWQVNFDSGVDGWCGADGLVRVAAVPALSSAQQKIAEIEARLAELKALVP